MITASDIFDKHSLNAIGRIGSSKYFVIPAMEEYAELKVKEYIANNDLVISKDKPTPAKQEEELIMPFGKHKGKKISDVPDDYLLWLYEQGNVQGVLGTYLDDNIDAIKANVKQK